MLCVLSLALAAVEERRLADSAHVHGHGRPLCGCEKDEPDHPFTINCADSSAINQAYNDLKTIEEAGTAGASSAKCSAKNAAGLMEAQQAFFILQAHHDYCDHDTLTYAQEQYVHEWETHCIQCAIERKYDAALKDCPRVNCNDVSVVDAAFWVLNTTCIAADNSLEYEWGGIFATPLAAYTWVSQATINTSVDGTMHVFKDPDMKMAFFAETATTDAAIQARAGPVGPANNLLNRTSCVPKYSGDTITASEMLTECFKFVFPNNTDNAPDFMVTIQTTGTPSLSIFTQHVPIEFERSIHYLLDGAAVDIPTGYETDSASFTALEAEPDFTVGASAGHEHRRRLEEEPRSRRRLGALGSCCNNLHQIGAFKQIVAYHDLCDHDDIPMYVENGLHDYEASCEAYFCNAVSAGYDGTICPSPPSPPLLPASAPAAVEIKDDSLESGAVAGIVIATVIAIIAIILVILLVSKEKSGKPMFTMVVEAPSGAAPTKETSAVA